VNPEEMKVRWIEQQRLAKEKEEKEIEQTRERRRQRTEQQQQALMRANPSVSESAPQPQPQPQPSATAEAEAEKQAEERRKAELERDREDERLREKLAKTKQKKRELQRQREEQRVLQEAAAELTKRQAAEKAAAPTTSEAPAAPGAPAAPEGPAKTEEQIETKLEVSKIDPAILERIRERRAEQTKVRQAEKAKDLMQKMKLHYRQKGKIRKQLSAEVARLVAATPREKYEEINTQRGYNLEKIYKRDLPRLEEVVPEKRPEFIGLKLAETIEIHGQSEEKTTEHIFEKTVKYQEEVEALPTKILKKEAKLYENLLAHPKRYMSRFDRLGKNGPQKLADYVLKAALMGTELLKREGVETPQEVAAEPEAAVPRKQAKYKLARREFEPTGEVRGIPNITDLSMLNDKMDDIAWSIMQYQQAKHGPSPKAKERGMALTEEEVMTKPIDLTPIEPAETKTKKSPLVTVEMVDIATKKAREATPGKGKIRQRQREKLKGGPSSYKESTAPKSVIVSEETAEEMHQSAVSGMLRQEKLRGGPPSRDVKRTKQHKIRGEQIRRQVLQAFGEEL
jgi:hypothetical protein